MADYTQHYGLTKPDGGEEGDFYDVNVFNNNADIIDKALYDNAERFGYVVNKNSSAAGQILMADDDGSLVGTGIVPNNVVKKDGNDYVRHFGGGISQAMFDDHTILYAYCGVVGASIYGLPVQQTSVVFYQPLSTYGKQTVTTFSSNAAYKSSTFERTSNGGVWGAWRELVYSDNTMRFLGNVSQEIVDDPAITYSYSGKINTFSTGMPTNNIYWNILHLSYAFGGSYGTQIVSDVTKRNDPELYVRQATDKAAGWGPWKQLANSDNTMRFIGIVPQSIVDNPGITYSYSGQITNTITGMPSNNNYWNILHLAYADNKGYGTQIVSDVNRYTNPQLYVRQGTIGWGSWKRIGFKDEIDTKLDRITSPTAVMKIARNLANYESRLNSITGALKLTLPSDSMLHIIIRGYDNTPNCGAWELIIGGHCYITPLWGGTKTAVCTTKNLPNGQIRFGHDGTRHCIVIGEISTTWSYPAISVTEVVGAYLSLDGWNFSFITSFSGIEWSGNAINANRNI